MTNEPTRKRGDAGHSFEACTMTFICAPEKETIREVLGPFVLPVAAHLLQILVAICTHRLDPVRHLHWIHRDLTDEAAGAVRQGRKVCVCVHVSARTRAA